MKRWALILFLLSGCTLPPRTAIVPPMPPQRFYAPSSAAYVAPQKALYVTWDYPIAPSNIVFELWSTTNLARPFTLWCITNSTAVPAGNDPARFFKCRASNMFYKLYSDWAHD